MSEFYVGQKVICIGKRKSFGHPYDLAIWPDNGGCYTIKTRTDHENGNILLTFAEIDNSHMVPAYSQMEPGFPAHGFRPEAAKE